MGLFGGSAQSTQSLSSNIDFSPVLQFGEQQTVETERITEQTQTTSPRLDDSMGLSVGVGVGGGSGSGGTVSRAQQEETTIPTDEAPLIKSGIEPRVLIGGLLLLGAIAFFKKKKGK